MNYDDRLGDIENMKEYEYSILRYIHDHSGGEYVNMGIVLYQKDSSIFKYRINERYGRISKFFNDFEGKKYKKKVESIENYLKRIKIKSNESLFPIKYESLRDLMDDISYSPRSSFTFSEVRNGIGESPLERVNELYGELVLFHEDKKREIEQTKKTWIGL